MDTGVEQFVAVTGASVEDARRLLEACEGNLDLAINMHMEGQQEGGATDTTATTAVAGSSYEELHGVRAPIPQTSGVLIEESQTTGRSLRSRRLPATVFDPFQDYSRVSHRGGNVGKVESLADLFKPPFDLIFTGTFDELRMMGQAKKRWLLVNLQDSKEFASQVLNRDVWSHEGVKAILSEHFLFWQIHSITDDGLRFKQLYHVTTFPYVAILDPRTGEKIVDWTSITVAKFIPELKEFLCNNRFEDDESKQRGSDGLADMSEEEQLQAAIRASLREIEPEPPSDPREACESDEFVSLSSSEEEDDVDGVMEEEVAHSHTLSMSQHTVAGTVSDYVDLDVSQLRSGTDRQYSSTVTESKIPHLTRKRKLSADNESTNTPPVKLVCSSIHSNTLSQSQFKTEKGAVRNHSKGKQRAVSSGVRTSVEERLKSGELQKTDVSRVLIRLPDGSRLEKAFMRSSPIVELFTYLCEKGINPEEHDIVTNFPRRALKELDHLISFQEANFYPSVTVFVQD